MKFIILFFLCFALVFTGCNSKSNTLTEEEKADGWKLLFDGESFSGCGDYNRTEPTGPLVVEDGIIKAEGYGSDESGYIVTDAKGHDTGGIYESYGRGWLAQIPEEKENILNEGEWNKLHIKVQGDNVQTWLNGQEMVNLTDYEIGKGQGRIALQIHDGGGIKVL